MPRPRPRRSGLATALAALPVVGACGSTTKGRLLVVEYVSVHKLTADDRALFDQFLSTFQFT